MVKKSSELFSTVVPSIHPDDLLTPAEVCLKLGISRKTLQRLTNGERAKPARAAKGKTPGRPFVPAKPAVMSSVRVRGCVRYRRAAVDFYISLNERNGVAA